MKFVVSSILFFSLLSGCSQMPRKAPEPINGPKATVNVDVPVLHNEGFNFFIYRHVYVTVFDGARGCPWGKDMDHLKSAYLYDFALDGDNPARKVEVPVGSPVYVRVADEFGGSTCRQVVAFSPQENGNYSISVKVHQSGLNLCDAKVLVGDPESETVEPSASRAGPTNIFKGLFSEGEICTAAE